MSVPKNLLDVKYDLIVDIEEEKKEERKQLVEVNENPIEENDSDDDPDLSSSHCD